MTATMERPLSSHEVCHLLDLTYRQLDYACRKVLSDRPGSGVWRQWDYVSVDRLTVAKELMGAVAFATPGRSPWPYLVEVVAAGPRPIPGWVSVSPSREVKYHGWVAPLGEVGITARWRPVRGGAA